ncbi:MAG: sugar ABC transporter permease [Candidatus Eisenbacteria bacterium]|uniref:Sugar ABC transporter permease n=1 Tax=Eiseniibacteriota bacterium TaxID=2212470 RepID=A0A538UEJ4_UNCEI|nr:MAG: sugar ABC transporter permease [Candidatus Eisenbacteria bacterium]
MRFTQSSRERLALLMPAALLLGVVVVIPIGRLVLLSFERTELNTGLGSRFAGLAMHARLWQDGRWWGSLGNTLVFTLGSVGIEMLLGVTFAVLLDQSFPGRRWARAIVLVPWALPTAVMALAWGWIFNDSFGVLNDLLTRAGLLHGPVAWLGRPGTAMAAMVVADVWKTTPFVALVVLAGLQGIPRSTLDAARIDGATPSQLLWRVVLPLIRPACLVALAFRVAQGFGAFDLPYVMTGGGPGGSTETVSLYAYRSFYRYLDFGYGAATAVEGAGMALLLFAAILWLSSRAREAV